MYSNPQLSTGIMSYIIFYAGSVFIFNTNLDIFTCIIIDVIISIYLWEKAAYGVNIKIDQILMQSI